MTPEHEDDGDRGIPQDMLAGRKFSLAEAIAREGGSFLKGESLVPKLVQARAEINLFIDRNVTDSSGVLKAVLQALVASDEAYTSRHLQAPLNALREFLEVLIQNPGLLYELVRQVDIKWGQLVGERPHFQQPGQAPHPEDEYTHESVRQQIVTLFDVLSRR